MDSELVSDCCPENRSEDGGGNTPISFTEAFYSHLPYYLSIGMTWDEYWKDDVTKVIYYRKKDKLDRQRKNNELYLQGLYFYQALCSVAPALMAFNKNPKIEPYLDEPFALTEEEQEERERKKNQESLLRFRDVLQKASERK